MSASTPLQSFLGGLGLSIPVQALLVLNGNVFGISGFVHRAVRGSKEAVAGVLGLFAGGLAIGWLEGVNYEALPLSVFQTLLGGLLVGVGSKLSNGCTSGHMICGISRFSRRSLVATATFTTTAIITSHLIFENLTAPIRASDWTLGPNGKSLLSLQVIVWPIYAALYYIASPSVSASSKAPNPIPEQQSSLRLMAYLSAGFNFAIALRLSNLTNARRVVSFLLTPLHSAFDDSLMFLAIGAIPLSALLYRYARGNDKPRLGGQWSVPSNQKIDSRLVGGAAIFGIGWGLCGVCPGPGLVNLGRAISSGSNASQIIVWLGSVVIGGLLV